MGAASLAPIINIPMLLRPLILVLLAFAGTLSAQRDLNFPPATGDEAGMVMAGGVNSDQVVAHARTLCEFGSRRAGTPSAERAVSWVVKQLESWGGRADVVVSPPLATWEGEVVRATVVGPTKQGLESAWLIPRSPALPACTASVEMEGQAVASKGSAVLLLRDDAHPPTAHQIAALKRVGVAFVLVGHPAMPGRPSGAAPVWEPSEALSLPVVSLGSGDTEKLTAALKAGPVSLEIELRARTWQAPFRSVTCLVAGNGTGLRRAVAVVANLDGFGGGPGAGAGAGGAAAVLAMARALLLSLRGSDVAPLPFDVVFCWWGDRQRSEAQWRRQKPECARRIVDVIHLSKVAAGIRHDCVYVGVSGEGGLGTIANFAETTLAEFQGRRGFWKQWAPMPAPVRTFGSLVVISSAPGNLEVPVTRVRDRGEVARGDVCPVLGTSGDLHADAIAKEPMNPTSCARAGIVLLGRLARELLK